VIRLYRHSPPLLKVMSQLRTRKPKFHNANCYCHRLNDVLAGYHRDWLKYMTEEKIILLQLPETCHIRSGSILIYAVKFGVCYSHVPILPAKTATFFKYKKFLNRKTQDQIGRTNRARLRSFFLRYHTHTFVFVRKVFRMIVLVFGLRGKLTIN
jgi:hypothetical protein